MNSMISSVSSGSNFVAGSYDLSEATAKLLSEGGAA